MVKVSNNDVAKTLAEEKISQDQAAQTALDREQYFDHVVRISAPKEVIINESFQQWDGVAQDLPAALPDFEYIKLQELWFKYGIRGQLASVYVLDSGIEQSHPAFRLLQGLEATSFLPGDISAADANGHGTWTCGKIAAQGVGLAPRCKLTSLRVLDANGSGTVDATTAALKSILADHEANIVNISFGSPVQSEEQKRIIKRLTDLGVIVVAAAGNYDNSTLCYPASNGHCVAVAATSAACVSSFYSYDVARSAASTYSTFLNGQFRKLSGSSMATPVVTGLLTLGISYLKVVKGMTNRVDIFQTVLGAFAATVIETGVLGKDKTFGFGGINGLAFFERLAK